MKKLTFSAVAVAVFALGASTVFAANMTLTSGGLGHQGGDVLTFGFAVCNGGATALTTSVPVTVSANGVVVNTESPAPIAPGACEYAYLPYASFNMTGGETYSVNVTVDPNKTVISNTNNQSSYTLAVPETGAVLGASSVNRINLLANEIQLVQSVISKIESILGR